MFSETFKNERKKSGLSQRAIAEKLHVSQQTVASWENGTRMPSHEIMGIVANYFNVTVDYLIGRQAVQRALSASPVNENHNEPKEIDKQNLELSETTVDPLDKELLLMAEILRRTDTGIKRLRGIMEDMERAVEMEKTMRQLEEAKRALAEKTES